MNQIVMKLGAVTVSTLLLMGCSSNSMGGNPRMTDNDINACIELSYITNPYDGSNSSLFDYDAFDSYYSEIDHAFWSADDPELINLADSLRYEIDDVLDALSDDLTKSEIQAEVEEIDWYSDELNYYCIDYVYN